MAEQRAAGRLLCLLAALITLSAPARVSALRAASASAAVTCDGAHDLIVEHGPVALHGSQSFARLCVQDDGILVVTAAVILRVGILYVAPGSAIAADGADGHYWATHDCIGNDIQPDGRPGGALSIVARHAIIAGRISSNGGNGLSYGPYCGGSSDEAAIGHGGRGGSVLLVTPDLSLSGRVTATGGAGGNATPTSTGDSYAPSSHRSGDGGAGGHITLVLARPDPALLQPRLDVSAGAAGAPGRGPTGASGAAGTTVIRAMTAAEQTSIPAQPASPITVAAMAPARQPLDPALTRSPELRCGAGDLDVRRTTTLSGVHQYVHVCVENGGALIGSESLTLTAQTISVAPQGRIALDGASPMGFHWSESGRYESQGACTAAHTAPHAGIPGPAGAPPPRYPGEASLEANPGGGGGLLTLIAHTVVLDGPVSAAGGTGQDGAQDFTERGAFGPDPLGGGGGGSGGGVYVVAQRLQLGGQITVAGGQGGLGNGLGAAAGAHGSAGCIKLFADALDAPMGMLPLVGPSIVGRPLPSDPVASLPGSGSLYFARTRHTLSDPFLAYWRRWGGLATFGYPQTEPFQEDGRLVQYTDRFRLERMAGRVRTAALGRLLTTGRRFARVAPIVPTPDRLYFPATGHTLSGRFLTYWRDHDGAALLGAPLSEVVVEGNGDGSGRRYPLQWFENGRLEYHPELAGTRYAVEPGLLGVEALQQRGWLPPLAKIGGSPSGLDAGGAATTHLYAVANTGTTFGSDGSRQWRFLWSGPAYDNTTGCVNIAALAAADAGHTLYAAPCGGGMWRSRDAGQTWAEADQGLPTAKNIAELRLVVAPDQRTVYAAGVAGIYKTTDAGATWSLALRPTEQDYQTTSVAVDTRQPARLWAGTEGNGLYRSDDAGAHWVHADGAGFPVHVWVYAIAVSPADSSDVYVSTIKSLYHTRDGGAHWTAVDGLWRHQLGSIVSIFDISFDPLDPQHIYIGANEGLYVSRDGGATWVTGHGLARGGYPIVVSRGQRGLAYVAAGHVYRTVDGGLTWQQWDGGDLRGDDAITNLAGDIP